MSARRGLGKKLCACCDNRAVVWPKDGIPQCRTCAEQLIRYLRQVEKNNKNAMTLLNGFEVRP